MDKYKFGNKLCSLREDKGLTQKELAVIIDVSDKAISKWENGQSIPRMETLESIADFFNVSLEELLTDEDAFIERHKVLKGAYKNKNERVRQMLMTLGLGSILLVTVATIFDVIIALFFGNSNVASVVEQNIAILSFPVSILTAFVFVNSFVIFFVKSIISFFSSSSECIEAEDKTKLAGFVINKLSGLFSLPPAVIAVTSFLDDNGIMFYAILYFASAVILSINFFTLKYDNINLYFTENGMFEKSVEYGDFHLYSSFDNVESNIDEVLCRVTDRLTLKFTVNDKKYKCTIQNDDNIKSIASYLKLDKNISISKKEMKYRAGKIAYVFMGIGAVIMAFGYLMFMSNMQLGTKQVDYKAVLSQPVKLDGTTTVIEYDNKIFCHTEQNCAVDVFDLNGSFLFAVNVPVHQNGVSRMYIKNDNLYLCDRLYDIYRYDFNGRFLGRCTELWDDDDMCTVCQYDKNDNLINELKQISDSAIVVIFFDEKQIQIYDVDDERVLTYADGKTNVTQSEYTDIYYDLVDDAVFVPYGDIGEFNGAAYYTYLGSLYRSTADELTVLYKESFFDWYKNSVMACWLTGAVGMAMIAVVFCLSKRKYKKLKK